MKRKRLTGVLCLAVGALAFLTWWCWPETSSQKVHRILRQKDSLPKGKFNISISFVNSNAIDAEWNRLGPEDVPALVEALNDPQCPMRYLAAGRLGEIGDPRAIPGLIQALDHNHGFIVRMWAAHALGDLRDSQAVEPLIQCLEDEESCVRSAAARSLGKIGDQRTVEPLIRLLWDEEWYVQMEAIMALGRLGNRRAIDPIRQRIEEETGQTSIRQDGQKALMKLGAEIRDGKH
jgi:HEAT repeat protein